MHTWNQPILDSLAARSARLPHALLVHGPRGVGKLALAERISQTILCESSSKKPCGVCDGCRWFLGGNHPEGLREGARDDQHVGPLQGAQLSAQPGSGDRERDVGGGSVEVGVGGRDDHAPLRRQDQSRKRTRPFRIS